MMTVKELQEELKKFPEDTDILMTDLNKGYFMIGKVGRMKVQNPSDNSESWCPVLMP